MKNIDKREMFFMDCAFLRNNNTNLNGGAAILVCDDVNNLLVSLYFISRIDSQ